MEERLTSAISGLLKTSSKNIMNLLSFKLYWPFIQIGPFALQPDLYNYALHCEHIFCVCNPMDPLLEALQKLYRSSTSIIPFFAIHGNLVPFIPPLQCSWHFSRPVFLPELLNRADSGLTSMNIILVQAGKVWRSYYFESELLVCLRLESPSQAPIDLAKWRHPVDTACNIFKIPQFSSWCLTEASDGIVHVGLESSGKQGSLEGG